MFTDFKLKYLQVNKISGFAGMLEKALSNIDTIGLRNRLAYNKLVPPKSNIQVRYII